MDEEEAAFGAACSLIDWSRSFWVTGDIDPVAGFGVSPRKPLSDMRDDTLDMLENRVRLPSNENVEEFMKESEDTGGSTGKRHRSKKPGAKMFAGPMDESVD